MSPEIHETALREAEVHLPEGYSIRSMASADYPEIAGICAAVYPAETPYTTEELAAHHAVFPAGQFVVEHDATGRVAGVHFTLRLDLEHFHLDDDWDTLTARDTFADHDPEGHTLYTAEMMTHPEHQHHGIARALTNAARGLARGHGIWRMVGGSRLSGYHDWVGRLDPDAYVDRVRRGEMVDPVLTAHLHDGWDAVAPIFGYLPHDEESAGWSAVIQWLNPECPTPPGFEITRLPRRSSTS
ncbi:MAG: GNAT family N-acetyltransferase [Alphaproteobacteria bacterium]